MSVTVKLPTQLRDAAGGATAVKVDGGTVGEALNALYDEHGELRSRLSDDDEIRAGIRLLAETTGIFTETAGGVTVATLAKLAARGDIGRDERVVAMITGDGLKTIDAVRDTFEVTTIPASIDAFDERFAPVPVEAVR